jgi:PRC-barrel domain
MSTLQSFAAAAMLATAVLIAVGPTPARSQAVELVVVDVTAVAKGYRTSKLTGSDVVNDHDERIGTIDDIIIGRDRVLFAVLQVGGFLGLGGQLVAVPYQALILDDTGGKIVLPGASRDELKKLPEFKYGG